MGNGLFTQSCGGCMKIGDLVYIKGTNREVSGVIISVTGLLAHVLLNTDQEKWIAYNWLEVIHASG